MTLFTYYQPGPSLFSEIHPGPSLLYFFVSFSAFASLLAGATSNAGIRNTATAIDVKTAFFKVKPPQKILVAVAQSSEYFPCCNGEAWLLYILYFHTHFAKSLSDLRVILMLSACMTSSNPCDILPTKK